MVFAEMTNKEELVDRLLRLHPTSALDSLAQSGLRTSSIVSGC